MRRLASALLVLLVFALAPATAAAAPAVSGEFPTGATPLSAKPRHLTLGSDGNIWAVLEGGAGLAKVTPTGAVTEFTNSNLTGTLTTEGITTGPDGNLWVTGTNKVVKISPSAPTAGTATAIAQIGEPEGITTGPDGNLWTASGANLIKIPPGAPATYTHFDAVLQSARDIALGGNGQLWVADRIGGGTTPRIASFTTAGVPTYYNTVSSGGPYGVAAGPGTQMAFGDPLASPQNVGRISPGGTPQTTPTPDAIGDPTGVVFGNDGGYWFARFGKDDLLRLTPTGQVTTLPGFSANSGPRQIAKGPGDTLWVSLETAQKIGRVSGVSASAGGGGGGGGTTPDIVKPALSKVGMSDTTVVVGPGATPLTGTAADATGTTIRYTLSEAAKVSLRIDRRLRGKRVKKGKKRVCAKPTRKNRKKKTCTRLKKAGTLTRTSHSGKNTVKFTGRIGRKALKVGKYRLTIVATDAAGNKSKAKRLNFRVVKPPHKRAHR
jgi:streptogramin lyase